MSINKKCKECGAEMQDTLNEDEPLIIYRCPKCGYIEFESINGYEG